MDIKDLEDLRKEKTANLGAARAVRLIRSELGTEAPNLSLLANQDGGSCETNGAVSSDTGTIKRWFSAGDVPGTLPVKPR